MTDNRREAIERLIEAVEHKSRRSVQKAVSGLFKHTATEWPSLVMAVYDGSLDAAKELHESVLPEWLMDTYETLEGHIAVLKEPIVSETTGAFIGRQSHGVSVHGEALARLLAILRALASEEGGAA